MVLKKQAYRYDLKYSNSSLKQFEMSFSFGSEQVSSHFSHRKQTPWGSHVLGDSVNEQNCKSWKRKNKTDLDKARCYWCNAYPKYSLVRFNITICNQTLLNRAFVLIVWPYPVRSTFKTLPLTYAILSFIIG